MNKFKKSLFALAVAASLGLFSAVSAYAQGPGVAWQTTSLPRQVRGEGVTETVGEIVLLATGTGGNILAGSSIDFVYSARLRNSGAAGDTLVTTDYVTCTTACDSVGLVLTLTRVGNNTLRLSFTGATEVVPASATIVISQVRLEASAGGVGPLTATMSGVSPNAGTNPISFTEPVRTVAVIIKPSLPVTDATDFSILNCDPPEADAPGDIFTLEVTEAYPAAVTSLLDELAFSSAGTNPTTGNDIEVLIRNVPEGYIITPVSIVSDGATLFDAVPDDQEQTDDDGTALEFVFRADPTLLSDTATAEVITMTFDIGTDGGDPIPAGGLTGEVIAAVRIGPVVTSGIVRFVDNDQGEEVVGIISDCQTYLLFSWNAYTGDGAYDTGFAINNSALDPAPLETEGETGAVTLYFYRAAGGTNPAPVVIDSAVAPGETATYVLSQLGAPFTGYVIAVCNFRYGHGINFLSNFTAGGYAQGFQALVLFNPRPSITESLGH